jgi:hypothetical protein
MKRLSLFLLTTLLFAGCEENATSPEPIPSAYEVTLYDLPDSLTCLAGHELTIAINGVVRDENGVAAPGVPVEFLKQSGEAEFDRASVNSDASGHVSSLLRIDPSPGASVIHFELLYPGGSTPGSFTIHSYSQPARIDFIAPASTFYIDPDESLDTCFTAVVSDSAGVGIADLPMRVGLTPADERYSVFGSLSAPARTDSAGRLPIRFNSAGSFGREKIRVTALLPGMAEPLECMIAINVQRRSNDIGSVIVRAFPSFFSSVPPDSLVISEIRVMVRDINNVGMKGIRAVVNTDIGSLSGQQVTDSIGQIRLTWRNEFEIGIAHIFASIPGTDFEAWTTIQVVGSRFDPGYLQITTDRPEIYADFGLTTASITVLLKDGDRQSLANKLIRVTSTHGAINSPIRTNEFGVAHGTFTDVGLPSLDSNGNLIPAKIYAQYDPFNLIDSCEVTIRPRSLVEAITLVSSKAQMIAGSVDNSRVVATSFLANGAFAHPGTLVHFQVSQNNGSFSPQTAIVGNYGVAESIYNAGNFPGVALLSAFVRNDDEQTCFSNEVQLSLLPGPPNLLRLIAYPSELNSADPDAFSTIRAVVSDTAGNAVGSGYLVRFSTTLGEINSAAITDSTGVAYARLIPVMRSGIADVRAWITLPNGQVIAGNTAITIIGGAPNSIEITADPPEITAGWFHTSTIRATVRDNGGNLVDRPTKVVFSFVNQPPPPAGCTYPNQTQIDSATTVNGVAVISVGPGSQVGVVWIRATTWRDSARMSEVEVESQALRLVSGPPAQMAIDVIEGGEDIGDGFWRIPISARIYDLHRNPISHPERYPITWSVEEQFARIEQDGAEYWLIYHSRQTNDSVTVSVSVEVWEGTLTVERRIQLPLQHGNLLLRAAPQSWELDRDNPDDSCLVWVGARLIDGHGIDIDNALVQFRCSAGRFYRHNLLNDVWTQYNWNEEVALMTGQSGENDGEAVLYFVLKSREWQWGEENNGIVRFDAHVAGHPQISNQAELRLTRP